MAYTDEQLADEVRGAAFEQREGRPVLPLQSTPLGQRLRKAVLRDGGVHSGLGPLAAAALRDKGFEVVTKGGKEGLAADAHRAGGTPRAPMPDEQLADEVRKTAFERRGGRPVLPLQSTPFGKRLFNAVARNGKVKSGLGPLAAAALRGKGFEVVTLPGGREGLAADTHRVGRTPRAPVPDEQLADGVGWSG
ncbi:hypothetical protein, partial [Streptomyces mirabilis]|uniref:hypothetical protein n=1 Tax=Streptomyces mirabilis TaxID=68239 RepID=UPI00340CA53F